MHVQTVVLLMLFNPSESPFLWFLGFFFFLPQLVDLLPRLPTTFLQRPPLSHWILMESSSLLRDGDVRPFLNPESHQDINKLVTTVETRSSQWRLTARSVEKEILRHSGKLM